MHLVLLYTQPDFDCASASPFLLRSCPLHFLLAVLALTITTPSFPRPLPRSRAREYFGLLPTHDFLHNEHKHAFQPLQ